MSRPAHTTRTSAVVSALAAAIVLRLLVMPARLRRDRGDVPGWVLITVMTAGLVSAIWMFAGPALVDMFKSALASVSGP
jgi:hypothetical protein